MLQGQQAHCQVKELSNAKNCRCVLDYSEEGLFPSGFCFVSKTSVALICYGLVVGGGRFRSSWGPQWPKNLFITQGPHL